MFPGVQAQCLFKPLDKTKPVADDERADIQDSFLKLLLRENGIRDGLEMPLECLVTTRFGIHEFGSQSFDLMQDFLTGRIQRSSKSRIHDLKRGPDGVQTGTDLVSNSIEDLHPLNTGYRFPAQEIASAKNIEEIDLIFLQCASNTTFQNGSADPRHYRRYRTAQNLINRGGLSEIGNLCRPADVGDRRENRILHRRTNQH